MIAGIIWALVAGLMLGLYALPGKFTKDFKEENTWGLFFMLTMFVVPIIATLVMMKGVGEIFGAPEVRTILPKMVLTSVLWGIGVMMWGKAIHHIGVSLGFSLFIGTVILIGSLLPFFVDGVPPQKAMIAILAGLGCVLAGIVANGKAGILRERDEAACKEAGAENEKKSMGVGASIHLLTATPHTLAAEYITSGGSYKLRQALCGQSFMAKDGWVSAPQDPGLGIQIDETVFEKYAPKT